jgi:PAN domain-containing protein
MSESNSAWWSLGGVAALITALTGVYLATRPGNGPGSVRVPVPARAEMGLLESGTNRQGADLSNFEAGTPEECSEACRTDDRCKAMTFVAHPGAQGGICWLKSSVAPMSNAPGMISAVKHYNN